MSKVLPIYLFMLWMMLIPIRSLSVSDTTIHSVPDTLLIAGTIEIKSNDSPVMKLDVSALKPDELKRKKIVSALLAFPFPFGFMGAHRVMLGCKPWVPVVYVVTFGGCFGILPMIDFCAILFSKDIEQYENNPHIFMWLK